MKNPEEMTRYELRAAIDEANEVIENTITLSVALRAAGYLQDLYDELASRPTSRSLVPYEASAYDVRRRPSCR